MVDVNGFVEYLKRHRHFSGIMAHHKYLEPKPPRLRSPGDVLDRPLREALAKEGIRGLYSHQAEALERLAMGENVVVATPTASGKSLVYTLPVLQAILKDHHTKALFIFPLKALEQDQLRMARGWIRALEASGNVITAIFDGDTPPNQRRKLKESPPHILITNPDMLHLSLLPFHDQWKDFLKNLRFVVLDELHTYKGIFGSHIVQVLRRLRRVCRFYGSAPQFITLSATIGNPGELAQTLTGLPFSVVEESGAPQAGRHVLFMNPVESPYTVATRLFRESVQHGLKTIAFTQARKITELIHTWLIQEAPQLAERISSYRAGFLPEERRDIERKLASGEMDGVISTSALEMGIDIGGLDVCILVGYPGTIVQTWQRGGRVGRQDRDSLLVLVAQPDALDQYFMRHPDRFFRSDYEKAVVDPANRVVLKGHLVCAASELPLEQHGDLFDLGGNLGALLREMERERLLLRSASGEQWYTAKRRPQREVDIRSAGDTYTILEEKTHRVVGKNSGLRALTECHQGAVYLHRGEHYLVTSLDLQRKNVRVRPVQTPYYTKALSEKDTQILEPQRSRPVGNFLVQQGRLRVTERIVSYEKRRISGQDLLSVHPLDLPPVVFDTVGIWLEIEDFVKEAVQRAGLHFMGGIHALEHAIIALFPLFALCDRDDVGGISIPLHPQLGKAAVFVYDGHPEGVGLAERAYQVLEELLEAVLSNLEECDCEEGCPGCIHSPKCGSGNKPLDKAAAILILKALMGKVSPRELGLTISSVEPEEDPTPSVPSERISLEPQAPQVIFFDLETQKTAEEVGGWQNKHLMRLSVAVIYDTHQGAFQRFHESEVDRLLGRLRQADLIVGFNVRSFDYKVLSAYSAQPLEGLPTFDILEDLKARLGFRLSLDHLAFHTLGEKKTADGLQAVAWFREGRLEELAAYCQKDVEITRELFEFGCREGYVLYETRDARRVRVPVEWEVERILRKLKEAS